MADKQFEFNEKNLEQISGGTESDYPSNTPEIGWNPNPDNEWKEEIEATNAGKYQLYYK